MATRELLISFIYIAYIMQCLGSHRSTNNSSCNDRYWKIPMRLDTMAGEEDACGEASSSIHLLNNELISNQRADLILCLVVGQKVKGDRFNSCFSSVHASGRKAQAIHG